MTFGDVLAVVSVVLGVCLSAWALMVGVALLFADRAARARAYVEVRPWRAVGSGVLLALTAGGLGFAVIQQPNGLVKVFGWGLLSALLAVASVGAGGLALLVGARIERMDPRVSPFHALARGSALLAVCGLAPLIGWFAFAPVVAFTALGAGFHAVFRRPIASSLRMDVPDHNREAVS